MQVKPEYRAFKQLINEFKYKNQDTEENNEKNISFNKLRLEPKLIYNTYNKMLKLEFKIGNKNMYVLKNLIEFYENMINSNYAKYGTKLAFKHTKESFELESQELLDFLLKYAEILKYANETAKEYAVWNSAINDRYITVSNSGIDELFEILKDKSVAIQVNGK